MIRYESARDPEHLANLALSELYGLRRQIAPRAPDVAVAISAVEASRRSASFRRCVSSSPRTDFADDRRLSDYVWER